MGYRPMFNAPSGNVISGCARLARSVSFRDGSTNIVKLAGGRELVRLTLIQKENWKGADGVWQSRNHMLTARVTSPGIIASLKERARGGDYISYRGMLTSYEVGGADPRTGMRPTAMVLHLSWIQVLNQKSPDGNSLVWDPEAWVVLEGTEDYSVRPDVEGDIEEVDGLEVPF